MLIQGGVLGVSVGSRCSRIGGGLRGDSLFSADGAAVGIHGGCVVLSRVVCDLLVGRKASSCYSSVPSPTLLLLLCELSRSCL